MADNENILWAIVPYTRGKGIGPAETFPHFLPVHPSDYHKFSAQTLDFVVITDYHPDLSPAWQLIKPNGHLCVFLPDDLRPEEQCHRMESVGSWDLVFSEGILQVYKKLPHKTTHTVSCRQQRPKKTACVVRYGGYGDMTQTANILPGLQRQGYHVTVMTTPKGQEILQNDPHIDAWFIQDTGQVPNELLGNYWDFWRARFDKFVNLSMSIEGRLLMLDSDFRRHWDKAVHKLEFDHNYTEFTCMIAGVPVVAEQRFYPSDGEVRFARNELKELKGKKVIMWALSGSSMHKFSPYTDSVVARTLMNYPDAHFIFVGDMACQVLEGHSWMNEPRVWCKSGKYSIRETMTLAQHVDIVVGPQTGVVDCVGMDEKVRKIILMSHSTPNNLTKHWRNTLALEPKNTPCYPCHMLHTGWGSCPKTTVNLLGQTCETVACTADIGIDDIFTALRDSLNALKRAA